MILANEGKVTLEGYATTLLSEIAIVMAQLNGCLCEHESEHDAKHLCILAAFTPLFNLMPTDSEVVKQAIDLIIEKMEEIANENRAENDF